jgi:hypothetical protein
MQHIVDALEVRILAATEPSPNAPATARATAIAVVRAIVAVPPSGASSTRLRAGRAAARISMRKVPRAVSGAAIKETVASVEASHASYVREVTAARDALANQYGVEDAAAIRPSVLRSKSDAAEIAEALEVLIAEHGVEDVRRL